MPLTPVYPASQPITIHRPTRTTHSSQPAAYTPTQQNTSSFTEIVLPPGYIRNSRNVKGIPSVVDVDT